MKSLKKTLVLLVVLSMILSAVSPVFAFNDVVPEVYEEQANKMAAFGVFTGDGNGNFNAEQNITRAEMAKVIGRLMGLTENEAIANKGYASNFSDVKAGEWYTGWVNLVAGRGIINGFPDGTFRPSENVTQAQAVTMIVKALGWGVVVDQSGTWPANYITKASELRLFKDAADSDSELVTRGNVAIYCYNALTAKMWDVAESTDGVLTSKKTSDTILAKYFSDFVNEYGEMKLVEGAKVFATPLTGKTLGVNQIVLDETDAIFEGKDTDYALKDFIEAKAGGKNKEEKTYLAGSTSDYADKVVAFVEDSACANLALLYGKTVDVIFGKDNKIAYIAVTEDTVDNAFVTAWDYTASPADATIEIDGVEYEFASSFDVYVFGNKIGSTFAVIDGLFTDLEVADVEANFNRTVQANITLDEDEEIKEINFIFSDSFDDSTNVAVVEDVVKSITKTGKIKFVVDSSLSIDIEKDEDAVRVIKDNEIASLEDIKLGDVLTFVYSYESSDKVLDTIYVASNRVEGEITKLKNNVYTVDGDEYNTTTGIIGNSDGEIEEAIAGITLRDYCDEDVELYLNFMGEVFAVVATTEATDSTLGIVESAAVEKSDDVDYLSLKIATDEGTKKYKIYNKRTTKDYDEASEYGETFTKEALVEGALVIFAADADNVIKSNEIEVVDGYVVVDSTTPGAKEVVASGATTGQINASEVGNAIVVGKHVVAQTEYEIGSETVKKLDMPASSAITVSDRLKTVTVTAGSAKYSFKSATLFNNYDNKPETIKSWESLCTNDTTHKFNSNGVMFYKEGSTNKVLFYVANLDDYASTAAQYAVYIDSEDVKNEDDEWITNVTLFVDGEEVTYECEASLSGIKALDLVTFTLEDEVIDTLVVKVHTRAFNKLDADTLVGSTIVADGTHAVASLKKGFLEAVASEDADFVTFVEKYDGVENTFADFVVDEDGVIIYDLTDGYDMASDLDDLVGNYVYGFKSESTGDYDVFVILK